MTETPRPPRRPPTVADGWHSLRLAALHPDSPPEQVREMRRAFYAGVRWVMTTIVDEVASQPDLGGELLLENIELELYKFSQDVRDGRA